MAVVGVHAGATASARTATVHLADRQSKTPEASPTKSNRVIPVIRNSSLTAGQDAGRAQVHRHRDERARYRRALRIVDHYPTTATATVIGPGQDYLWPPEPAPEEETLLDLLHRELGAHLIAG